jgi:hypothetical protein
MAAAAAAAAVLIALRISSSKVHEMVAPWSGDHYPLQCMAGLCPDGGVLIMQCLHKGFVRCGMRYLYCFWLMGADMRRQKH